MAVVQISRIQIRRGQRNSGTGLPQLASGEMAWAVDSQELFIGNGSVAEGSPAVGNTKIITAKDLASDSNLFGLVQYVYKIDENITVQDNSPVTRTIQQRLDDSVNTTDFGTLGNYNPDTGLGADDSNALQFAINQLFLNATGKASSTGPSSVQARVILQIPAGTFRLRSTLYVPSYTTLIGAGADKTIIYYDPMVRTITGSVTQISGHAALLSSGFTIDMVGSYVSGGGITNANTVITSVIAGVSATISTSLSTTSSATFVITPRAPAIQFVNDSSIIGTPSPIDSTQGITQPRNIQISGLTIHDVTGHNTCLQLDAVKDSLFEDLNLSGSLDNAFHSFSDTSRGISLNVHSTLVTTENNIFRDIRFSGFSYAVYAKQDSVNNIFENCFVTNSRQGFALGVGTDGSSDGQTYGPRQTQIVNSKFYNIKWQGVFGERGEHNSVIGCTFMNVGVDGSSNTHSGTDIVRYPQIFFGTHSNHVSDIKSDRNDDLEDSHFTVVYPPVVAGHGVIQSGGTRNIYLGSTSGTFLRLPTSTDGYGVPAGSIMYNIEYVVQNTAGGALYTRSGTISVSANTSTKRLQLSDEYNFASNVDDQTTVALKLNFSAILVDDSGIDVATSGGDAYGILFNYNNSSTTLSANFVYSYKAVM